MVRHSAASHWEALMRTGCLCSIATITKALDCKLMGQDMRVVCAWRGLSIIRGIEGGCVRDEEEGGIDQGEGVWR